MSVPVIFIANKDDQSKEKTREYLKLVGKNDLRFNEEKIEKQMISVQEENSIVPNKHEDVEIMRTFLYKGTGNPPGMENGMHESNKEYMYHWYVPSRVGY